MTETRRNPYYDNLKFILICLVIVGHVIEQGVQNGAGLCSIALYDTIFFFVMPCFVFISGLFSKRDSSEKQFWLSILRLTEPLLIISVLQHLPSLFSTSFSLDKFMAPGFAMWYLISLICWRLMTHYVLDKFVTSRNQKILMFLATIIVSLLSGFITWGNRFSIPRTLFFLPYFIAGYYTSRYKNEIILAIRKLPLWIAIVAIVTIFVGTIITGANWKELMTGNVPYCQHRYSVYMVLIQRLVLLIISVVLSMSVMMLIPEGENKYISKYGRDSLFFYCYHTFFVLVLMRVLAKFQYPVLTNFGFLLTLSVFIIACLCFMNRLKILHWLLNPISSSISKHNTV